MESYDSIKDYYLEDGLDLKKLTDNYSGYIYTIISNKNIGILSSEDIEEIISDVLFAVWKNRDNILSSYPLKAYISGITKNVIKNKLRLNKNINIISIDDDESGFDIKDSINIEDTIEQNEEINVLEKALKKLGKDNEEIFRMFYFHSMKIKDISKKTNLSEYNVSVKLHRIRKHLKKELEKGGYSYGK